MNSFEIKNYLNKQDLNMLHEIYLLRCLTISQIYSNFYENDYSGPQECRDKKLNELLNFGIVEEIFFSSDNSALFLTRLGIEVVVNEFKIPLNIVDEDGKIKRGYYRASELKMQAKNIPHQVHLNQFMLDFKKIYEHKNMKLKWEYYDEKYVSHYTKIRPDGLIRIMDDVDLFLETDMSTESKAQLEDKWKNYKSFLNSSEHRHNDHKVIVLFIIENTNLIENRKDLIKKTASDFVLNDLDDKFELIVGTKHELLKTVFNHIIPDIQGTNYRKGLVSNILSSRFGFNISDASILKKRLSNQDYGFFIRKLDESNNIIVENGRIQGYFVDYCYNDSLSLLSKISYFVNNLTEFKDHYKWSPSYIVICEDLDKMFKDLHLLNLECIENIYFTTITDLQSNIFHHALYQFHTDGTKYTFVDSGLKGRKYLE